MMESRNITLIGMPGAGKSTLGVLLAKELGYPFIDTDIVIQSRIGKKLAVVIAERGLDYFQELEERFICDLDLERTVIATGGSVVYSDPAMRHLKAKAVTLWLQLSIEPLRKRLGDLRARGVVIGANQTFEQLYRERQPLYAKYADVTICCDCLDHSRALAAMLEALGRGTFSQGPTGTGR